MDKSKIMDWSQLDDVSFDEVSKIFQIAEDTRAIVIYRLEKIGSLKEAATYDKYDELLGELQQSRDVRRRRGVVKKLREENIND